jgi:hypothetical protein
MAETSSFAVGLLSADGDADPARDEEASSLAKRILLDVVPSRHTIRTIVVVGRCILIISRAPSEEA